MPCLRFGARVRCDDPSDLVALARAEQDGNCQLPIASGQNLLPGVEPTWPGQGSELDTD